MNTYFEVKAEIDGEVEILFGSYDKQDCIYEKEAERDSWKEQGYKKIKIVSRQVEEKPDKEVYPDLITKKELFIKQAPSFNFELDEDELLEVAIERGFVTVVDEVNGLYKINEDYEGVE